MRILFYLVLLLIIVLGVTFAYLNSVQVTFNYYLGKEMLPLSLLMVFSLGVGLLLGCVAAAILWLKLTGKNMRLKQRLKYSEKEIASLRHAG